MTQEQPVDIGDTYKQIAAAEQQATKLENALDAFEAKLDSILKEAESINKPDAVDNSSSNKTGTVDNSSASITKESK
ncbi:uncharacterized protein KGF55_000335 [Candida pseudojiufengensis]|uniref:uncharacterized protein n=1 Tax=Candida pseudojiufengensis TaxID=497109 RepID=UPI002225147E|nr:uncharacterized protein KGF55_000335 [Candida pseudojiufengensis]KAI5966926.1 hypothetical protein KGF55_000335 [Candida pseudojiufengensis]